MQEIGANLGSEVVKDYFRRESREFGSQDSIDSICERAADSSYVLLGKASHGTGDYYRYMAEVTKRMIESRGASFVAIEWDWPDTLNVNDYVKQDRPKFKSAKQAFQSFSRFPEWMWANEEMLPFVEWLREHNLALPFNNRVGFYGLDLQNEGFTNGEKAMSLLKLADKNAYKPLREEALAQDVLSVLRFGFDAYSQIGGELYLDALETALLDVDKSVYQQAHQGWSERVVHMHRALNAAMKFYGEGARSIVWLHNTHVGDARYTNMADHGDKNIGQILREKKGEDNVFILGFGTNEGTVRSSDSWGVDAVACKIPPAADSTWEAHIKSARDDKSLIIFDSKHTDPELLEWRGQRAIGVVYSGGNSCYVPTKLTKRYDAFVLLPRTSAVTPLKI